MDYLTYQLEVKGWLPQGTTQGDLKDGDFAWLSDAYKDGKASKTDGRKLPYKVDGTVSDAGWKAAWSRVHQMDAELFQGGPSQQDVIKTLLADKPKGVETKAAKQGDAQDGDPGNPNQRDPDNDDDENPGYYGCTGSMGCATHGDACPNVGQCTGGMGCQLHGDGCACTSGPNCKMHGDACPNMGKKSDPGAPTPPATTAGETGSVRQAPSTTSPSQLDQEVKHQIGATDMERVPGGLEYKTVSFTVTRPSETKDLAQDQFEGYAVVFNTVDESFDIIAPGAFTETMPQFKAFGKVCWQHDWKQPIGKPVETKEDGHGLYVKGQISQTTSGKDALILMRDGVVDKLSIGYKTLESKILTDTEAIARIGTQAYMEVKSKMPWFADGIRLITKARLYEVSPVTIPSNNLTDITGVKSAGSHDGLTFQAQFDATLAAVEDFVHRSSHLAQLRFKEGRMLSQPNHDRLKGLRNSLQSHVDDIDELLAANAKTSGDQSTEDLEGGDGSVMATKGSGAAPQTTSVTPEEAKALLRAEADRELKHFLASEARRLGVPISSTPTQ